MSGLGGSCRVHGRCGWQRFPPAPSGDPDRSSTFRTLAFQRFSPLPVWMGIWNQLGLALSSGCRFPGTVNPDGSRSWWIEGTCPIGGNEETLGNADCRQIQRMGSHQDVLRDQNELEASRERTSARAGACPGGTRPPASSAPSWCFLPRPFPACATSCPTDGVFPVPKKRRDARLRNTRMRHRWCVPASDIAAAKGEACR